MIELQLNPQADDQKLLAQVIDFYQRTLKESPDALDYLRKRGINNPDCIEQFRIGYANRSLGTTLPNCDHKAGKQIRSRLQELHILRPDSGHEHFNGSVVFPIHSPDGTGRIVDIYGRKTGTKLRKGTAMDTFMAPDRQGVWNFHGFGVKDEVILFESLFDALLLWCHGYRSIQKLGLDPQRLFASASRFANVNLDEYLGEFMRRSEDDLSIEAMGYVEGEDAGGFRYIRTW